MTIALAWFGAAVIAGGVIYGVVWIARTIHTLPGGPPL